MIEKIYLIKRKLQKFYFKVLPDKQFLEKQYKVKIGKSLNLKNPTTYTEKLNWLKLYNRKPEYTQMVDKYRVRQYIKDEIGKEHLIPLIGVWDRVEDIDFSLLPNEFVLKCNHDNGVIICKDKNKINLEIVKEKLNYHYNRNFYKIGREWVYKDVDKKIICEKYMVDEEEKELIDYKFHCFNGEVKAILVITGREPELKGIYYDAEFNTLPIIDKTLKKGVEINKPKNLEVMINIAKKLSKNIPFVRIDLYNIKGKVYFGEITFYPDAGFIPLQPYEWEEKFGEWIKLDKDNQGK